MAEIRGFPDMQGLVVVDPRQPKFAHPDDSAAIRAKLPKELRDIVPVASDVLSASYNPYEELEMECRFRSPDGRDFTLELFYAKKPPRGRKCACALLKEWNVEKEGWDAHLEAWMTASALHRLKHKIYDLFR
jgi:hypothetical protein